MKWATVFLSMIFLPWFACGAQQMTFRVTKRVPAPHTVAGDSLFVDSLGLQQYYLFTQSFDSAEIEWRIGEISIHRRNGTIVTPHLTDFLLARNAPLGMKSTADVRDRCGTSRFSCSPGDTLQYYLSQSEWNRSDSRALRVDIPDTVILYLDLVSSPGGRVLMSFDSSGVYPHTNLAQLLWRHVSSHDTALLRKRLIPQSNGPAGECAVRMRLFFKGYPEHFNVTRRDIVEWEPISEQSRWIVNRIREGIDRIVDSLLTLMKRGKAGLRNLENERITLMVSDGVNRTFRIAIKGQGLTAARFRVFNTVGVVVYEMEIDPGRSLIDIAFPEHPLPAGNYLAALFAEERLIAFRKFSLQR